MSNPFQPPNPNSDSVVPLSTTPGGMKLGHRGRSGLVRQVPVFATLLMVQGALVTLVGISLIAVAFVTPEMMSQAMRDAMREQPQADAQLMRDMEQQMNKVIIVVCGSMGIALLATGGISLYAGVRNLNYRSRTLGIVAVVLGFLASLTIWCAPTSIALGIYGLVVLLNSDVVLAFQLREQGCTIDQVKYGDW